MILDFLSLNMVNVMICSTLLNIFYLNDGKVYYLLIIDILINGIPFITIIIVLFYYLNKKVLLVFNNTFIVRYFLIIIYYFLFNIILYSIFNRFNIFIINIILNNLIYNLIFYFIGLKYLDNKYN